MSWVIIFVVLLVLWTIAVLVLEGISLKSFDKPVGQIFDAHPDDVEVSEQFLTTIELARANAIKSKSIKQGLSIVREFADNLSAGLETDCVFIQTQINTTQGQSIEAEWAIAPGADTKRRVLFFHGGAFFLGSANGHRKFSDRLSKICNAAVLSVNYRMLPEHSRKTGIADAQDAYQWIIGNGPQGPSQCGFLMVAGDSAGGNFALMLSSWSKANSHQQPDAVIGFSPSLDSTMSSPSFKHNRKTDYILGPNAGKLSLLPRPLFLWLAVILLRIKPSNPLVSPIFYDLADLPPTLLHASSSELLLGDSIRYTNKAVAQGSDVTLQIWQEQLHDWHLFNMGTGSAESAWIEVEKFIGRLNG